MRQLIILAALTAFQGYTTPLDATLDAQDHNHVPELRDEGLCNMGWIAGNTKGTAVWPETKEVFGEESDLYEFFISLKGPNEDESQAMVMRNMDRYEECRNRGREQPYSRQEMNSRIVRFEQIFNRLKRMVGM